MFVLSGNPPTQRPCKFPSPRYKWSFHRMVHVAISSLSSPLMSLPQEASCDTSPPSGTTLLYNYHRDTDMLRSPAEQRDAPWKVVLSSSRESVDYHNALLCLLGCGAERRRFIQRVDNDGEMGRMLDLLCLVSVTSAVGFRTSVNLRNHSTRRSRKLPLRSSIRRIKISLSDF